MMFLTLLACSLVLCIGGTGWPDKECGRSRVYRRERVIYGGHLAKDGEFPWMVSIQKADKDEGGYCGGSLIKENIVLTAAHCMKGFVKGYVAAGYLDKKNPGRYYQRKKIEKVVCHRDDCGSRRDIALIKLALPFNIKKSNGRIGTVCLPQMNRALGQNVTITGWGLTSPKNGSESSRLLAITVPVRDDKFCQEQHPAFIPKRMFCAGIPGQRTGKGDSGGPAVERIGRKSVQVGIVSFGIRLKVHVPSVLVKVSAYSYWIADTLKMLQ